MSSVVRIHCKAQRRYCAAAGSIRNERTNFASVPEGKELPFSSAPFDSPILALFCKTGKC